MSKGIVYQIRTFMLNSLQGHFMVMYYGCQFHQIEYIFDVQALASVRESRPLPKGANSLLDNAVEGSQLPEVFPRQLLVTASMHSLQAALLHFQVSSHQLIPMAAAVSWKLSKNFALSWQRGHWPDAGLMLGRTSGHVRNRGCCCAPPCVLILQILPC
jgi:hypothetical protein